MGRTSKEHVYIYAYCVLCDVIFGYIIDMFDIDSCITYIYRLQMYNVFFVCNILSITIVYHKSCFGQKAFYSQDVAGLSNTNRLPWEIWPHGFPPRLLDTSDAPYITIWVHHAWADPGLTRTTCFATDWKRLAQDVPSIHTWTRSTIDPHKLPR